MIVTNQGKRDSPVPANDPIQIENMVPFDNPGSSEQKSITHMANGDRHLTLEHIITACSTRLATTESRRSVYLTKCEDYTVIPKEHGLYIDNPINPLSILIERVGSVSFITSSQRFQLLYLTL